MKIPKQYTQLLFVFFMALCLSCIMSLVMSLRTFGMEGAWIARWLSAWGFAFIVAFPTAYLVVPRVRKLVDYLTE